MRNPLVKIALLSTVLVFLSSGCALMQKSPVQTAPDSDAALENHLAAQEYGKALEILKELEKKNGREYSSQTKLVLDQIREFENKAITEARNKADRKEVQAAITIIDNSLQKVPTSKDLVELRGKLVLERDRRMEEAQINLLLLEAEYTLDRLKWYREQAGLKKPSVITRWQMNSMEGSLDRINDTLLTCEKKQREAENTALAARCLQMAEKIHPENSGKQVLPVEKESGTRPEELSETRKSRPAPTLVPPSAPLSTASEKSPATNSSAGNRTTSRDETPAENPTPKLIELYMQEGIVLYRSGKISEARDIWQKILVLDNEHPAAIEQIARAEKILKRLDNLKKASETNDRKQ